MPRSAFRGSILHFLSDPGEGEAASAYRYLDDGLLLIENGCVAALGPAPDLLPGLPPGTPVADHRGCLMVPGFVDTHIHYPQTDVIGCAGWQLLDWLERCTFPAERAFRDPAHARAVADFFLDELLRNGTTTALVFGTVHPESVDAFFAAAAARGLRMICGKVLMDRNCPDDLRDTPESGYRDSAALIERWHGAGRLHYAITPRFAVTSSDEQLALAGKLARERPEVHIHSHVAENVEEVRRARELFPARRSYLDVYDHFGLLRERAVYAHCIHLDAGDRQRMAQSGAAASFCPTSNLFLGSGLFDLAAADAAGYRVGVGTDVGGGTSFSMLRTLAEAYKVLQLRGQRLSSLRAFYLATLGGARALRLDDRIGSFAPGREADFVVLDPAATPLLARRSAGARSLAERLALFTTLGDERCVRQVYVEGRPARLPAA
ncbi:MAG TPA: guanine deaminase [Burkholderiales bacterium]|nr:guanine deaminase [Burkholderiales bacterium]